jgi:2',3'-cyclic-nucleotide 2'-phosphodiesterase (5'-nucleotidase family)
MPRWIIPLLVSLALVVGLAVWFQSTRRPAADDPPGPGLTAKGVLAEAQPLLKDWPHDQLTLVLSGEQHGYLEPCGCSETQSGGYSRRADLLRQMTQRGFKPLALDLGGLVRRRREQSRLKYQTMLAALGEMDYVAVGVGPEDLALGADFLLSQGTAGELDDAEESPRTSESTRPPLLGANVRLFDSDDLPGAPVASRLVKSHRHTIGITAILDPALGKSLEATGALDDVTIRPPHDVLPDVIDSLIEQGATFLVLLAHAPLENSIELARQFPRFNLVVSAGGPEDPLTDNPRQIGQTTVLSVGQKGKYAGVVGIGPPGERSPVRFELVNLDDQRFTDHPKMIQVMKTYQQTLQQLDLAAAMLPLDTSGNRRFIGSARCGECHTKALAKWASTPHAGAFESLARGRKGQEHSWVPRTFDAECLACHVTGWEPQEVLPFKSGFVDRKTSAHLLGNGCENCHGPGDRHVELVEAGNLEQALLEMRVTPEQARRKTCIACHDLDNSPKFDFDTYWPKIAHPGRD